MKQFLVCISVCLLAACATSSPRIGRDALTLRFDNGVCSGTAIGPHAILTATHCLDYKTLVVRGRNVIVEKRMDDGNDHSILIVAQTFKTWSKFSSAPVLGESVYVVGSPNGLPGIYSRGSAAGTTVGDDGRLSYLFNLPTWFGDSGAAIYGHGGIVAVVTAILTLNDGRAALYLVVAYPFNFSAEQLTEASR